LYLTFGIALIY